MLSDYDLFSMVHNRVERTPGVLVLLCLFFLPGHGVAQDDLVSAYRIRADAGESVQLDGLLAEQV
jgi:hypothetical protein